MTDADQIAIAIIARLKQDHHTFWIDPEIHSQQHEFIKTLIEERANKLARRKKIEDTVAGSIILSAILVTVGLIGSGALTWLKGAMK